MELTVNFENLSESERENLTALVEKSTKPKSKVWKPKTGEDYYSLSPSGIVSLDTYIDGAAIQYWRFGNCFRTKEEAEFATQHRLVEVELQRFADEHNDGEIDWESDTQRRYYIFYTFRECDICIDWCSISCFPNTTYFTSKEIAQSAIDTIGEERLIKYYFGIKN